MEENKCLRVTISKWLGICKDNEKTNEITEVEKYKIFESA
jgi:hypothetical protein